MSMVPPTPKKPTFLQGLGDLLRNPQFMSGLQNLSVGLTEHPDPGFHARQGLAINQNMLDTQDQQFRQQQFMEQKQAEARRQAFLNQMLAQPTQQASGVDPAYRPPGMAPPPSAPLQGMTPANQAYVRQLSQVDPAAALKLVTQHRFQQPKTLQPTGKMQELATIHGVGTPEYKAALARTYEQKAEKPSERDKKVSDYMRTYGMSRGDAVKIVDGKKKLVSDSEYGGYHMVDMVTGKSEYRSPQGQQLGQSSSMPATKEQRKIAAAELKGVQEALRLLKDPALTEAISGGVGLVPRGKQAMGGIVGQAQDVADEIPLVGDMLPDERVFEGTKSKRSQLSLVDRAVKQALLLNKRAPVQEQLDLAEKYSFLNMGLDETQAEEVRQTLIRNLENRAAKAQGILGPATTPVGDFGQMSRDELLQYNVDNLTPDQFEAFDRALSRYE